MALPRLIKKNRNSGSTMDASTVMLAGSTFLREPNSDALSMESPGTKCFRCFGEGLFNIVNICIMAFHKKDITVHLPDVITAQ
jgi:hypothetical protein